MNIVRPEKACKGTQKGAVLFVSLLLMIVMTVLGLSSVSTVLMEEKMSANAYDRSLAFQAAEAALRVGEARALVQSGTTPPNAEFDNGGLYTDTTTDSCGVSPCSYGLCSQPDKDCTERWLDSDFTGWVDASEVSGLAGTPQYFIEFLGGNFPCNPQDKDNNLNCSRYRITAQSNPAAGRAAVVLQTVFATD